MPDYKLMIVYNFDKKLTGITQNVLKGLFLLSTYNLCD